MAGQAVRITLQQITDRWIFAIRSRNGAVLAVSDTLYKTKSNAKRAAASVAKLIAHSNVVIIDDRTDRK